MLLKSCPRLIFWKFRICPRWLHITLLIAASADMFYFTINYKNKTNMKVVAQRVLSVRVTIVQQKISMDLTRTCSWITCRSYLWKKVIKLILIFLSNSFFNFFMKMKNEKRTIFCFPFFLWNGKANEGIKIQRKDLLNMKMVVNYLNLVLHTDVKTRYEYKVLNIVFQFIKDTKWHLGCTDSYHTSC